MAGASTTEEIREIEARILGEHGTIRRALDRVAAGASSVLAEPSDQKTRDLEDAIWDLYIALDDHLVMEESELLPLLGRLDGPSSPRSRRLLEEHHLQRGLLLSVVDRTETGALDPERLAAVARRLVESFRADMEYEERDLADLCTESAFALQSAAVS